MAVENDRLIVSRRYVLAAAGIAVQEYLWASGDDFWNKKPPVQWSTEEIDRLTTKSPWAKQVRATYISGQFGGCSGGGEIWSEKPPLPRYPPGSFPPRMESMPREVKSPYVCTVRWESAKPILLATKIRLPDKFANHYVIGVSGFSSHGDRDCKASTVGDNLANLTQFTTLRTKQNDLAHAALIERRAGFPLTILFGFKKAAIGLTASHMEVEFTTRLDSLAIKAMFNLVEMMYVGRLAL